MDHELCRVEDIELSYVVTSYSSRWSINETGNAVQVIASDGHVIESDLYHCKNCALDSSAWSEVVAHFGKQPVAV